MELSLNLEGFENADLKEHIELYSDDLKSINTKENMAVSPKAKEITEKITLKKHSWNMLLYKY